jgi:DNA/RNA endonuclease G (NUC1)
MENKTSKRYKLSMEELEQVTGIGFFSKLKEMAEKAWEGIRKTFD